MAHRKSLLSHADPVLSPPVLSPATSPSSAPLLISSPRITLYSSHLLLVFLSPPSSSPLISSPSHLPLFSSSSPILHPLLSFTSSFPLIWSSCLSSFPLLLSSRPSSEGLIRACHHSVCELKSDTADAAAIASCRVQVTHLQPAVSLYLCLIHMTNTLFRPFYEFYCGQRLICGRLKQSVENIWCADSLKIGNMFVRLPNSTLKTLLVLPSSYKLFQLLLSHSIFLCYVHVLTAKAVWKVVTLFLLSNSVLWTQTP